ncbi:MAG: GMC family oxidoreductase [Richelia sp. RM2_1_2]|nr:GMC family oxidoreductase [Richelia sp. SM2_1_7]NJM18735.1 GMC family oxidoreductase [Richelia sp. SM1_7_0]NJN10007.1 GMC family oxidoreductase [Richelia sp. RM1_1_1]NJO28221.1 GMC family oxidoreductase [Richelia sp. SL_2_1]NJO60128.1 GMC family oxidoreductase [Richelia sp. RM2_1_2]
MIIDDEYYDVIIIGTGAGGGTLARKLAPTGKKILVLEQGEFLEKESSQLVDVEVFKKENFHAPEQWYEEEGDFFYPQTSYSVGGNTKIYSGVLQRMREQDFEKVQHQDGISPEWEVKYKDFESYYTEAEKLYQVHGQTGDDLTEPSRSQGFPFAVVDSEPQVEDICNSISKQGLHPAYLPIGIGEQGRTDAEDTGISPTIKAHDNVTLKTSAKVVCLHTNPSGKEVKAVEARIGEQSYLFIGHIIVLSCGAINSAALLLRSANEKHPKGLGNSSDLVGRNLMKQLMTVLVQLTNTTNSGLFQRTRYINDFYWGDENFAYPMGHIQNSGGILQDVIFSESPPLLSVVAKLMPEFGLKQLAKRSIGWWLQSEDLPTPKNRVRVDNSKLYIDYKANNTEAHDRLIYRWIDVLKAVDGNKQNIYPRGETPIQVVAHQSGTCRFGEDSRTSVLNLNCRTHDIDNLYVVDSSFFPSISATSPGLTVIANSLRVGEHLIERLG